MPRRPLSGGLPGFEIDETGQLFYNGNPIPKGDLGALAGALGKAPQSNPTPTPTASATPAPAPATPAAPRGQIIEQIMSDMGAEGWYSMGRPTPETKVVSTGIAGETATVPTGRYIATVTDGKGHVQPLFVTPGDAAAGANSLTWELSGEQKIPDAGLNPKPTTAGTTQVTRKDGSVYRVDAAGNATQVQGLPSEPITADEQLKLAQIKQRETNQALTGRYMTDEESVKFQKDVNQFGYDKAAEARAQATFEANQRATDQDLKQRAALFPGQVVKQGVDIASTQAGTAATQAATSQTQQTIEQNAAKFPIEQQQRAATLAGTDINNQRTQQQIAQGNAPTVATPGTGMYNWQRDPNTGELKQTGINVEYIPKTQAEIAARVGQIQSLMQAKGAEIQKRVDAKQITPDQGLSEYNAWHQAQVQPQLSTLEQAQQAAQFAQAKDLADMRRNAMTTAQNAGTLNVNAFNALREANPVGAGYAAQLQKAAGKSPYMKDVDWGSTVWQGPNPMQTSQQSVQDALKYIDPSAGKAAGVPMPDFKALDINGMLGAQPYGLPGGGGAPGFVRQFGNGGGAGAGDLFDPSRLANLQNTTGQPGGAARLIGEGPDDWLTQLQGRLALDQQQQQMAQQMALAGGSAPNQVAGSNYGANQAYPSGIMPWNY